MHHFFVVFFVVFVALAVLPCAAQAQLAVKTSDIALGTADVPVGGAGTNAIGTNGVISYAAGYSGPATGTAGSIQINGTIGRQTLISCEATKTMTNIGGSGGEANRTASPFHIVLGTSSAVGPGLGLRCNGLNSAVINLNLPAAAADRVILIGMTMDVTDVMNGGEYALSNNAAGGVIIRVRQQGGGPPNQIDITVDARASFNKDVSIIAQTDMNYDSIEFTGTPGAAERADMGTNGVIVYGGTFSGNGLGTPGAITLDGVPDGTSLEVFCSQSATLANASSNTIDITGIEVAAENASGGYGTGASCNGIAGAGALTFTYTSGSNDEVFVGGRLDGATVSGALSGNYSTVNAGGSPIDLTVVIP